MPTIFAPERIPFSPTASGRQKSPRVGRRGPRLVERSPTPSPPLFQWAATTLHADFSALKHPRLVGTPTASGRQKSPRVGRSGPRLVERSPTPSPPFSSGLRRRSTLTPVRSSIRYWLVHRRLRGGKSLLAWAAAAQGSSSVRRPLRLPFPVGRDDAPHRLQCAQASEIAVRSLNSHLRCGEEFEVEHERCVGRNARC